jgi:hypothetical protein
MATGNLRPLATPLPSFSGGVIDLVDDPNLIQAGTLGEGENLVPERTPRLATRGGSRILLKLDDDGAAAELSRVVAPGRRSRGGPPSLAGLGHHQAPRPCVHVGLCRCHWSTAVCSAHPIEVCRSMSLGLCWVHWVAAAALG